MHGHCAVAVSSSELVILGGWEKRYLTDVTKINVNSGKSSELAPLPEGLGRHQCLYDTGHIFVSGGHREDRVWRLDNNVWTALPRMATARHSHAMVVLDNDIFVLGGQTGNEWYNPTQTVEKLVGNEWKEVTGLHANYAAGGALVIGKVDGSSAKSCDGKIIVTGQLHTRDYHSAFPEKNIFDLTCKGGCIRIEKVVHDCDGNRMPTPEEMKLVKDLCEHQESCTFVPAPSFFGERKCAGIKKTWVNWRCLNHEKEIMKHQDGENFVLLIGGIYASHESWTPELNGQVDQYNKLPFPNNTLMWGSGAAVLGDTIYYCGGYSWISKVFDDCYSTRIGNPDWSKASKLQVARSFFSMTTVGDKIIITGGAEKDWVGFNSVEIFENGKWSLASWKIKHNMHGHCAVAVSSSELVILGGWEKRYLTDVTKINVNSGKSSELAPLPEGLGRHQCLYDTGHIFVSGGHREDRVWRLDNNVWTALPRMATARHSHAMVVLDNDIFVLGGQTGNEWYNPTQTVEKLVGNEWKEVTGLHANYAAGGALVIGKVDGSSAKSCDGKIIVTGQLHTRDYHSAFPEKNIFDLTCKGGCIRIEKVVHDCDGNRMPTPEEMKLVKDLCEHQESCTFVPAPSFFGKRKCTGIKKTWVNWRCLNHEKEIINHKDGNSCVENIINTGPVQERDFHSAKPEGNVFDVTCKGGCIRIDKVVHDCDARMPLPEEMKLVQDLCNNQERCTFTPAPSFFGQRKCKGIKKTWVNWRCVNHEEEITNMKDG